MFGRYKAKEKDFSKESLPTTRRQQFKAFLKNEKMTIFKISLILFLFSIPFLATITYQNIVLVALQNEVEAGSMTQTDMFYTYAFEDLIFNAIKLATLIIFGIGLSGALRIIRNLCWNEGVFFGDDFKKGIKQNFKQVLLPSVLIGLAIYLIAVFKDFYNLTGSLILEIGYILSIAITFILIIPFILFLISQITFYEGKLFTLVSNAFTLMLSKYLIVILFSTFVGIIWFVSSLFGLLFYSLVVGVFIALFSGIFLVIFHLYSLSVFDKVINFDDKKHYRKGLY
ncbi:MAG: hypothetical protein MJ248_03820 [Bacilli bacterium]|nr:hypothetical protein [Bacilli bacterium]